MNINVANILCPVDFSETSDLATRYAVSMAQSFHARMTLLHVVAPPLAALPGEAGILAVPQADINEIAEACRERLEKVVGTLEAAGIELQYKVVSGVPFLEIVRFSREHDFDLIVMGSHGRSGLGHLLIGSVAERVVRKAPCPVLTVKDRKQVSESAS